MLISLVTMVGLAWEEGQWGGSWAAIKQVWASKWNERAVLSLRRAELSHSALQMAVLCQEVVPAQYAFVAHTTNPTTGERLVNMCTSWQTLHDSRSGREKPWGGKAVLLPCQSRAGFVSNMPSTSKITCQHLVRLIPACSHGDGLLQSAVLHAA